MGSGVYYNEIDPFAAAWLKELMKKGLIPDGEIDTRSIADVLPDDLDGFDQCHFFAGIGGWSHALRLAGWPDDRPIWTGSCPCQPFSVAGKGKGKEDKRHLWPVFHQLIAQCRPPVVMGEQVAGKAGYDWFDGVAADLEAEGYASRAIDIPACAVNAPHIRQRLYWVATNMAQPDCNGHDGTIWNEAVAGGDGKGDGLFVGSGRKLCGNMGDADAVRELQSQGIIRDERGWSGDAGCGDMGNANSRDENTQPRVQERERSKPGRGGGRFIAGDMADANSQSIRGWRSGKAIGETRSHEGETQQRKRVWSDIGSDGGCNDMADADSGGCGGRKEGQERHQKRRVAAERVGFWDDTEWLTGADGKTRRSKPGICLLASGVPNRVGRLRGYGNAIVPPLAAEVIKAFMEIDGD